MELTGEYTIPPLAEKFGNTQTADNDTSNDQAA